MTVFHDFSNIKYVQTRTLYKIKLFIDYLQELTCLQMSKTETLEL